MSHTPIGGHPQGWEHKLADRSSLPPPGVDDKGKPQSARHVFAHPHLSKASAWRSETEGSSGSSARSPASPPYVRWARTLHHLLEDAEGVRLFRKYVGDAGGLHVDRLNFYFAVQGLRQEAEPAKIRQVVSAIYKFLRKSQLAMPEELKAHVKQCLKDGAAIEKTIFDRMEQEVTRAITETTYQAFLRSDAYVSYVSAATQPLSSPDAEPHARDRDREMSLGVGVGGAAGGGLATLHEGQELGGAARLTHGALLATQTRRLHCDVAPHRKRSVYSAHVTYGGYCPASRQDSERASLSSGRTDSDAVSLSGSSLDGVAVRGAREAREAREARPRARLHGVDRHAIINKEQDTAMMIPRTRCVQADQLRVLPPAEFAPLLIERLERVRRDQDAKERLERRLQEGEGEDGSQALPPQLVAAAIREKLQLDDDNDQDILDQHVSRVWSERTPGASPPGGRRARARHGAHGVHGGHGAHGVHGTHGSHGSRRAPSALSADSGHFDAPPDALHHPHSLTRRSSSKKRATELTDSGVSVVSEASTEPRLLQWVAEGSERLERLERLRASSAERDERRRDKMQRARGGGGSGGCGGSKSSSTSGGGGGGSGCGAGEPPHTVVVVSFLDESVPYRFKVPAAPLTLRVFKDYLPRKGNYRYFFKTECADLDNTVIQEEVSCDNDTLPMFEGKVMARVKSVE